MNLVDVIVISIAILAAIRGRRRGLVGQVLELGGGFLGLIFGVALGPPVASYFTDRPGIAAVLISLSVVFICLSIGQTIGYLIGHRFGMFARSVQLGGVDSTLGAGFGVLVWLLSFWIIGSVLVHAPARPLARALQESAILKATSKVLPKPPDLLSYLGQYLNTSGFPQVFAGLPRISEPVDLPTQAQARAAVEAAKDSTVRISVPACGGVQLGSGWIAADATVVTNAHVVAGGTDVTVNELGTGEHPGQVVLFDPEVDIAVIHVEGLTAPVLELQTANQDRGTPGATIGYPGNLGGEQDGRAAAVQNSYDATGRDIYGRDLVTREVYELRARVRQGMSGGPFVLSSGQVAGVVFAASTTDDEIGYALTGAEVADEVSEGAKSTESVSTGRCTR